MSPIIVIGCGYRREQLTLEAAEALKSVEQVILHTQRCGLKDWLEEQGVSFSSLDALYESAEDFDQHALMAAQAILQAAQNGSVAYAVFDVRDVSVAELMRMAGGSVRVIAAVLARPSPACPSSSWLPRANPSNPKAASSLRGAK